MDDAPKPYVFYWANRHLPSNTYSNLHRYVDHPEVPFNDIRSVLLIIRDEYTSCFIGADDVERNVRDGVQYLDAVFTTQLLERGRTVCETARQYFSSLDTVRWESFAISDYADVWQMAFAHHAAVLAYFRATQDEPLQVLTKAIQGIVSAEHLHDVVSVPGDDPIDAEAIAWKHLQEHTYTESDIRMHLARFPWLASGGESREKVLTDLLVKAKQQGTRNVAREKEELRLRQTELYARYPEVESLARRIQELSVFRSEVKTAYAALDYYLMPLIAEAVRRFSIDSLALSFIYRYEDMLALFSEGRVLTEEEVEQRRCCTVLATEEGRVENLMGNEAEVYARARVPEFFGASMITELKGTSAWGGVVRGIVRILPANHAEAARKAREEFHEGILVTPMTQPNILDIAARASAIITDEGGVLCHAAIISRERKIPCIVGTLQASRVLSDGDFVEVDANRGVVTIIERADI